MKVPQYRYRCPLGNLQPTTPDLDAVKREGWRNDHILVVSGMNVGILAFVAFWVLKRLRVGEVWASLVTVALS